MRWIGILTTFPTGSLESRFPLTLERGMYPAKCASQVAALAMIVALGCAAPQPSGDVADTVYTNGKIYTVNESQPWAEAVAIKDGSFLVLGSNAETHRPAITPRLSSRLSRV